MSEQNEMSESTGSEQSAASARKIQQTAQGYFSHVREVLSKPDDFFAEGSRTTKINGLISLAVFLAVFFLHYLFGRITGYGDWGFEFSYLIDAIKHTLAIAIPVAAAIFALKWQAGRTEGSGSLDLHIEKFGAALILPSVLLIIAIALDILDIRIHAWFNGAALVFVYLAVFMTCYLFAAGRRLVVPVLFTLGFYILYRLILLLF